MLGSKHRFIGQGYLAAHEPDRAITHLVRAEEENREFGALHLRTRFDLARARLCQPDSRTGAETEMKTLQRDATARNMPRLAAQAEDSHRSSSYLSSNS